MDKSFPIFKKVFGPLWDQLPIVFKKRYANRAYTSDIYRVEGLMNINYSRYMALFMPIFKLFGVLVPYRGQDIPTSVQFQSHPNNAHVSLLRQFHFQTRKPYIFNSRMIASKENEVIEFMTLGLGWKTHYYYENNKVIMAHKSFVLNVFGFPLRIPLELFVGKGHAVEEMISENSYKITMTMTHFLFGVIYSYSGVFAFRG